jgi:hypothetical protein
MPIPQKAYYIYIYIYIYIYMPSFIAVIEECVWYDTYLTKRCGKITYLCGLSFIADVWGFTAVSVTVMVLWLVTPCLGACDSLSCGLWRLVVLWFMTPCLVTPYLVACDALLSSVWRWRPHVASRHPQDHTDHTVLTVQKTRDWQRRV